MCTSQERCCLQCNPEFSFKLTFDDVKKRKLVDDLTEIFKEKIANCIEKHNQIVNSTDEVFLELNSPILETADDIAERIDEISSQEDLLFKFDILEIECRIELFKIIDEFAPM